MIKNSRLHILINDEKKRYIIVCPNKETILSLMELIQISNEALEDFEEDA